LRPVGAPPPPCTEGCVRHFVTCTDWWMKHRSKTADEAYSVCRSERDTKHHKMQGAGCVPLCKIPGPKPSPTPEPGKQVLYTFKKASGNPDCGKGNSNMLHDYGHGVSLEDCKRNCQDHCIDITWAPGNHHCKTFASCLNAGPNRGWEHYQKGVHHNSSQKKIELQVCVAPWCRGKIPPKNARHAMYCLLVTYQVGEAFVVA